MSASYDVVVVGARCAGAPLATLLARAGLRVCVVDKDGFPSDTLSTHAIHSIGVEVLQRLGVLDDLLRIAPPILRGRIVFDDGEAHVPDIVALNGAPVLSVRRTALDAVLLDAAADAGAEVRTQTPVTGLVTEAGRVAGVVTTQGEIRAPLVVGADGMRSAVAGMVGAPEYHATRNGRVFMWTYVEGEPTRGELWIAKLGDHAYLVTPTDAGLCLVAACPSIHRRADVRADREAVYAEGVRAWPELHEAVAGLRREGPVHTMAKMNGFFRRSAGPGWALVGDAGHFKDPTPGQGISDALRQAERLAAIIVRGLGGGRLDQALHDWWRWRDEDAWEMYWFAHDLGAAGPTPPVLREAQRRIAADPALVAATMRVFNHSVRPSAVFTPRFAMTTAARALWHGRRAPREVMRDIATTGRDEAHRRRAHRALPRQAGAQVVAAAGSLAYGTPSR